MYTKYYLDSDETERNAKQQQKSCEATRSKAPMQTSKTKQRMAKLSNRKHSLTHASRNNAKQRKEKQSKA